MKRFFCNVILVFFILSTACGIKNYDPVTKSEFLLNTIVEITLYEDRETSRIMLDDMFTEIRNCEKRYSRHIKGSEIAQINENPGSPVQVSEDTMDMIKKSIHFSNISKGLFDISIGALVDLWDINGDNPHIPLPSELDNVRKSIDYRKISLDEVSNAITIPKGGMSLDTGAIAKGFITDRLVTYLKEKKAKSAVINLGGNLYLYGGKQDGSAWNIGIRNPFGYQGDYLGTVSVENMSVVTSGIYERYFDIDGQRYHHILNPTTGYPENNTLASVSILSESSTTADGLSTATFLLGLEDGMALIEEMDGVQAIMVTMDKKIFLSSGIKDGSSGIKSSEIPFKITNEEYTIAK